MILMNAVAFLLLSCYHEGSSGCNNANASDLDRTTIYMHLASPRDDGLRAGFMLRGGLPADCHLPSIPIDYRARYWEKNRVRVFFVVYIEGVYDVGVPTITM